MKDIVYAFDLDGTVTLQETLPLLAKELELYEEMKLLTSLTMNGDIRFDQSFKLRFHVLNGIPLERIQNIMSSVVLDDKISNFIKLHKENCAIVTGNLDLWIKPLVDVLGCVAYSSQGKIMYGDTLELLNILHKSEAIRELKKKYKRVVAVGESFNDIPMFEEADVAVAYGGVHNPVNRAIENSDYVVYDGGALCKLLKML